MKLRTQLFLGYLIVFALMVFNAAIIYKSTNSLIKAQNIIENTNRNIDAAGRIETLTVELQNTKRAVLLNPSDDFGRRFEKIREQHKQEIDDLKNEVSNNPAQLRILNDIERRIQIWINSAAIPQMTAVQNNQRRSESEVLPVDLEDGKGRSLFGESFSQVQSFMKNERGIREEQLKQNDQLAAETIWVVVLGTLVALFAGSTVALTTTSKVIRQVGGEPESISRIAQEIGKGNLEIQFEGDPKEGSGIRAAIESMKESLRRNRQETQDREWLKTGIGRLNTVMSGDPDPETLASKVISEMTTYVGAQIGACYFVGNGAGTTLKLLGSYAFNGSDDPNRIFEFGNGLVGQAALENRQVLISDVPEDYFKIRSGVGEKVPNTICITPFTYEGYVKGVIEIGSLKDISELQMDYILQSMPALALAAESAERRFKLAEALVRSQKLSEELQAQQEELRTANEELEEQSRRLQESEKRLRVQQEELEATNEELEEKNELLKRQKERVEQAKQEVESKADELATASRYKSEFLSNMSHELRTPLNSLLLLSQSLASNSEGNLTEEQTQCAKIIWNSGRDLLNLIDEILDLAKIEAGRIDLQLGTVHLEELAENLRSTFEVICEQKNIDLMVNLAPAAPSEIVTDKKRIEQILKNLVSNAVKFTHAGNVTVTFGSSVIREYLAGKGYDEDEALFISIQDTGIGIAEEQQHSVFEAFQQVDGSIGRKYGGTGLGLSISRDLASLLGGEIHLKSKIGEGSTFTLCLPVVLDAKLAKRVKSRDNELSRKQDIVTTGSKSLQSEATHHIQDDRRLITPNEKYILVIEDDPNFAQILLNKCHERGFKCVIEHTGEAGLGIVTQFLPMGIILDIRLPGMDGWTVLSSLKNNTGTRHIPVHILSVEEDRVQSMKKGAVGHFIKPISAEDFEATFKKFEELSKAAIKRVLVVEDDNTIRGKLVELIGNGDVKVDEVATGEQAMQAISCTSYSCVVLDIGLPDMDGYELLRRLEEARIDLPPIIVHTARDMTIDQEIALRAYSNAIVLKDVRSNERLLDEVCLFLHSVVSGMSEPKRQIITTLHDTNEVLKNKKVLIVDDDMRTVFALSRLLADNGMRIVKAENGERALALLDSDPEIDLVLMDIMMPIMDGFQTMTKIREQEKFRRLPIIALTAKAMPKDREDCISAGASDYMTKPIDQERLLSMLRVWLYR